jgi:putative ubiquitin-RnfH superfamily antitoxin RatB of RatAB toxin-antitoxin module
VSGDRNPVRIRVEVAYALPDHQLLLEVTLARGATARQAVERSGILQRCPEIDLARSTLGVFGRIASPDARLRDGDRVEIYRALIADPKQGRRDRARRADRRSRG